MSQRIPQLRHAAPTDFQWMFAKTQHGLRMAITDAAQFDDLVAGDQAVAVDAHEALAEFGL